MARPPAEAKETSSAEMKPSPLTIAIVGRPNVGKSTLFNRIIGRRRAIVGDEPGITRDRLYGETEWNGVPLRAVDTGGIIPDEKELIPAEIFRQARVAFDEADAVVMVVDGRSEIAAPDLELARLLQRTGKPLFLAVNKMDSPQLYPQAEEFRLLGIQELLPVSAEHGTGVAELLEAIIEEIGDKRTAKSEHQDEVAPPLSPRLPAIGWEHTASAPETKIAIIGRPNVGKSTLLNQLTKSSRAIVSPIPGTTRDAVDEVIEHDGKRLRFIDTAGIRRKGKTKLMAEKLSVVMARKHLEAADIALIVVDASEGVTASDATIAGYAHESGRSVIVIVNKWDLLTTHRAGERMASAGSREPGARAQQRSVAEPSEKEKKPAADRNIFEQQARRALKFLNYAPIVFVSASEGRGIEKILETIEKVSAERRKRISTGEMNRFLKHIDFDRAPVPASRKVRIYYLTQTAVAPPTFILFTDRDVKLHFSYQRFLENQIRRAFGFTGTPIWIKTRPKEKR